MRGNRIAATLLRVPRMVHSSGREYMASGESFSVWAREGRVSSPPSCVPQASKRTVSKRDALEKLVLHESLKCREKVTLGDVGVVRGDGVHHA